VRFWTEIKNSGCRSGKIIDECPEFEDKCGNTGMVGPDKPARSRISLLFYPVSTADERKIDEVDWRGQGGILSRKTAASGLSSSGARTGCGFVELMATPATGECPTAAGAEKSVRCPEPARSSVGVPATIMRTNRIKIASRILRNFRSPLVLAEFRSGSPSKVP
jgi:hypothetical protein